MVLRDTCLPSSVTINAPCGEVSSPNCDIAAMYACTREALSGHSMFKDRILTDGDDHLVGTSYETSVFTQSPYTFEDDSYIMKSGNKVASGHGSHVSGIICELTPNNVKILPIKVLNDAGSGAFSKIYTALELINTVYSAQYNIAAVNMSIGSYSTAFSLSSGLLNPVLDLDGVLTKDYETIIYNLYNKGILTVVAAGN